MTGSLRENGFCDGLNLPQGTIAEILDYAATHPVYADRDERHGFDPQSFDAACVALAKPILVAQYFNVERDCSAVRHLAEDPVLTAIAASYLRSEPVLTGVNLWWTYPVVASDRDRDLHAHRFHRDVDAIGFVKFFFYLTDVRPGDGGHVCVLGSHRRVVAPSWRDRFTLRRFSDEEVRLAVPDLSIHEIVGSAGTGFVEDTFCLHKGLTPTRSPRLVLQFEFALGDSGVMHDRRADEELRMIRTSGVQDGV